MARRPDLVTAVSLAVVAVIVAAALFAPLLAPADPYDQTLRDRRTPPGAQYLLGADEFGRDILSRLLYGAGLALRVAVVATAIGAVAGVTLGLVAGFFGGFLDDLVMRTTDILLAFPYLLLAIAIVTALGPGEFSTQVAIGFYALPSFARLVRGSVLSLKTREFVEAARAQGAGSLRIMFGELLPNLMSTVLVFFPILLANAVLLEAALSFLGAGVQPPNPSWGTMISDGLRFIVSAPLLTIAPGIMLVLTVLSLNIFGEGVRDALDPRARVRLER
jgi:peptide/nickel transport system permease protein